MIASQVSIHNFVTNKHQKISVSVKYTKFSYKMSMCIYILCIYIYLYMNIYIYVYVYVFIYKKYTVLHFQPKFSVHLGKKNLPNPPLNSQWSHRACCFLFVGNPKKKKRRSRRLRKVERYQTFGGLTAVGAGGALHPNLVIHLFSKQNEWKLMGVLPVSSQLVNFLSALLSRRFVNHHEMFISRRLSHIPSQQGATIGRWLSLSQDGRC